MPERSEGGGGAERGRRASEASSPHTRRDVAAQAKRGPNPRKARGKDERSTGAGRAQRGLRPCDARTTEASPQQPHSGVFRRKRGGGKGRGENASRAHTEMRRGDGKRDAARFARTLTA